MATYQFDTSSPTSGDVATARQVASGLDSAADDIAKKRSTLGATASGKKIDGAAKDMVDQEQGLRSTAERFELSAQVMSELRAAGDRYRAASPTLEDIYQAEKAKTAALVEYREAETALAPQPNSAGLQAQLAAAQAKLEDAIRALDTLRRRKRKAEEQYQADCERAKAKLKTATEGPSHVSDTDGGKGDPDAKQKPSTPPPPAKGTDSDQDTGKGTGDQAPSTAPKGAPPSLPPSPSASTPGSKASSPGTAAPSTAAPSTSAPSGKPDSSSDDSALDAAALAAAMNQGQQPQQAAAQPAAAAQAQPATAQTQQKPKLTDKTGEDTPGVFNTKDLAEALGESAPGVATGLGAGLGAGVAAAGPASPSPAPTPASNFGTQLRGSGFTPPDTSSAIPSARPAGPISGTSVSGLTTAADVSGRSVPSPGAYGPSPVTTTSAAHGGAGGSGGQTGTAAANPMSRSMPMMPMMPMMGGPGGGGGSGDRDRESVTAGGMSEEQKILNGRLSVDEAVPGGTIAQRPKGGSAD